MAQEKEKKKEMHQNHSSVISFVCLRLRFIPCSYPTNRILKTLFMGWMRLLSNLDRIEKQLNIMIVKQKIYNDSNNGMTWKRKR